MSRHVGTFALAIVSLTLLAGTSAAQKEMKARHPQQITVPDRPDYAKEAAKDAKHDAKEAEKAVERSEKRSREALEDADKDRKRAEKAQRKEAKRSGLNRDAHAAYGMAVSDQAHLRKGLKLTREQKAAWKAIDRKYDVQYRALRQQLRDADAGNRAADATIVTRINALRDQERAELRALLTPAQQAEFDRHLVRLNSRR